MGAVEIIIIVLAVVIVIGVSVYSFIRKAKGKSGCCDCSSCPYANACHRSNKKADDKRDCDKAKRDVKCTCREKQ